MPFSPGLFPTRGVGTVSLFSKLNIFGFVCKSTELMTQLAEKKVDLVSLKLKMHHDMVK